MSFRAAQQGTVAEAEEYEEVEYEDDEEYDEEDDEEVDEDEEEEDFDGQIEEGESHAPVDLVSLRRVGSYLSWPYQGCTPIVLLHSACTGFAVDEESEDESMQHFAPARAQAMRTGKCRLKPGECHLLRVFKCDCWPQVAQPHLHKLGPGEVFRICR